MALRKTSQELIGLVDKLLASDKFDIAAKPYCLADLLETGTHRIANAQLDAFLVALRDAWVGDILRGVSKNLMSSASRNLVRRVVEHSAKAEVLERRLCLLYFAGLIEDVQGVVTLCASAGMGEDKLTQAKATLANIHIPPLDAGPCPF